MATFVERPVNDTFAATRFNVIEVSVADGDDTIDMAASDVHGNAALRLSVNEALATIRALTGAIEAALANRTDDEP